MERLSPLDASFLYLENEVNHMHIAAVAVFEGPPPGRHEIEEMISSKLHLVPRYRMRVGFVPFELGRPVWCDDPHFELGYHVRHTALPAPGSDEQLCTLVGRVMSQPLDRTRPLWETWVAEGLQDDRWAMLTKVHHCMVDGIAGADLLSVILDGSATAEHPEPEAWRPEPPPSQLSLLTGALLDRVASPRKVLRTVRGALEAPRQLARGVGELGDALGTFRSFASPGAESSLNGPIGPHRRWCWATVELADVKKIRSTHGGTVNDVVLAVTTRGFRQLLLSRDEPVKDRFVRTLVPVSLRQQQERGRFDNRVSTMFAELPVGIADPVECLASVQEQLRDLKRHHQATAAETLTSLSGFAPPMMLAVATRLVANLEQRMVQTVATNVPGPQRPHYAAGRRMLSAYPFVPLMGSVRIGVAIFSYDGQLAFGVTGDYDGAPDIGVLAAGIEAGIGDLLAAT